MSDFSYVRANSLGEAVALLSEPGIHSRVLAGGTDLVNQFRKGEAWCDRVVDVAHVPELRGIQDGNPIRVGAAVTHAEIAESALLQERAPILVQACQQIGSPQIRNIATIGGNVVNAAWRPGRSWPVVAAKNGCRWPTWSPVWARPGWPPAV
jgi:CO/xanthine dehydrogenase FAD-binding subunit